MTDAPEHRRSRLAWPTHTEPTTTPAGTHDHKQSNGPLLLAFLCIVLLFLCNVGLVWFILARGAARDAAEREIRELNRESWCQALDGFPQGNAFLDPLREAYGCGPGLPPERLTPEQQQQLRPTPTVEPPQPVAPPAPSSPAMAPPLGSGAVTDPPRATEPPAPPRPPDTGPSTPPEPDPEWAPLVDVRPLTDPLCAALGACV